MKLKKADDMDYSFWKFKIIERIVCLFNIDKYGLIALLNQAQIVLNLGYLRVGNGIAEFIILANPQHPPQSFQIQMRLDGWDLSCKLGFDHRWLG